MAWFRRRPSDESEDDGVLPELTTERWSWLHYTQTVADTSFWAVARRLPSIIREALTPGLAGVHRGTRRHDRAQPRRRGADHPGPARRQFGAERAVRRRSDPRPGTRRPARPALGRRGGDRTRGAEHRRRLGPGPAEPADQLPGRAGGCSRRPRRSELAAFDDAGFAEELDRVRDRGMRVRPRSWTTPSTCSPAPSDWWPPRAVIVLIAAGAAALPAARRASPPRPPRCGWPGVQYLALLAWITRRRRLWMFGSADGQPAHRRRGADLPAARLPAGRVPADDGGSTTGAQLRLVRAQHRHPGRRRRGRWAGGAGAVRRARRSAAGRDGAPGRCGDRADRVQAARSSPQHRGPRHQRASTRTRCTTATYAPSWTGAAGHRAPAGGVPVSGFDEIRLEGVS